MMLTRTKFGQIGACLVALSISLTVSAAPTGNMLAAAKSQFQQQHYKTSLKLIDDYLQQYPKDRDARFLQGLALAKQGKTDEAINVFELLTKQYPNQPEPFNNLAVLYAQKGQFDRARNVLLDAIRTHNSYATAYENLGSIYAKMAINAYASALDLKKQQVANDIKLALLDDLSTPQSIPNSTTPLARVTKKATKKETIKTANAHRLQVEQQVLNTILEWSRAWSDKNAENYLAYYAKEFSPPNGLSRNAWESQRRSRIEKPNFIKVTINNPNVKMLDPSMAELEFSQKYRSDSFRDNVKKVILMKKINGKWQIVRENASG